MTDIHDFIVKLRAIRDFQPQPLSEPDLKAVLEAARWTGSSKNRQDWSFIVVTGDRLQGLADHGDFTDPIRSSAATIVLVKETGGNMFDIGRAAQNIMLAAKARGVASCPITLHRSGEAREFLGAPDGTETRYAVALGYPADHASPRHYGGRKPADALVRYERY
ncbi:MAG TPA: nitroreductase family protein [Acidimicrobiia bacterium]